MAQVSTLTELLSALENQETPVQLLNDIAVTTSLTVSYPLVLESAGTAAQTLQVTAPFTGSLIYVVAGGALTLQNITLSGLSAGPLTQVNGGTLRLESGAVLRSNQSPSGGAVLCERTGSEPVALYMDGNARITQCRANYDGGGIYFRAQPGDICRISGQAELDENSGETGGAIYFSGPEGTELLIDGSVSIRGNTSAYGGGIWCEGALTVRSGSIRNNFAVFNGAGIYMKAPQIALTLDGAAVSENRTQIYMSGGGGVYLEGTSAAVQITDSELNGNYSGAGMALWGILETIALGIERSHLDGNLFESGRSGAIDLILEQGGSVDITGSTISHNESGALHVVHHSAGALTFHLTDAVLEEDGGIGGIYLESQSAEVVVDGSSSLSDHTRYGTGIFFRGASGTSLTIGGTTVIANNSAQGIYLSGGVLTLRDQVKVQNNRGWFGSGAGVILAGGTVNIQDQVEIAENQAASAGAGAGLYVTSGTVNMTGGTIHDNIAPGYGGGVSLGYNTVMRHTGGDIYSNTSGQSGGGVSLDASSTYLQTDSGTVGAGGLNTAAHGPGVYNMGTIQVDGRRPLTNGLWLETREAAAQITGPLLSGSAIQLDENEYVAPDPAAAPIVVAQATEGYPALTQADADAFLKPVQSFEHWKVQLSADRTQVLLVPTDYTIRYENLLGASNPNPLSYTYYTPDIVLQDPIPQDTRQFLGWYDDPQVGTRVTVIPLSSAGDRTLYARWSYTLTYHGNDAGGPPARLIPDPQQVPQDQTIILPDVIPVREGYHFTGWNTRADGSGEVFQPGDPFGPITAGADLYAQWEAIPPTTHLITYEPNDAGGPPAEGVPGDQEVIDGQTASLSTAIPTRAGYRFTGWNTAPDGTGTAYEPGQSVGPFYADLTIYAQWERIEHTLTYHGNDAGGPTAQNIPDPQTIYEGQAVSLSDLIPTREGYRFTGWNTQPDGSGAVYQPGASFGPATADADLYAQWEAIPPILHLLTYEANDVGGPPAQDIPGQQEVREGDTVALSSVIPTRTGYRFAGWNTAPDGSGTPYQPGQTVGPFYADLTIFAQWLRVEHTLTYHGNDEGGPPAQWIPFPQQVPEGQVISLPDAIPTREGYLFTGWNTRPDGSGTSYQPGGAFGPIFSDADLYAQWAALPPLMHTLTYYGNDAGGPPAQNIPGPVLMPDGQSVTLSGTIPTREGFSFTGWNTDPSGMGIAYQPGDTILDVRADIDLYAQWVPLPPPCYTLTYCGNDAGGPPACCIPCPEQILAGQYARISCCSPCRTCYCFTGWNTDPCGRGQTVCPGQIIGPVTGDVCLYAQWRRLPPPKPCNICR